MLQDYGDVYVVKDSQQGYFVEFQWVDDITHPNCKKAQDICDQIVKDKPFGEVPVYQDGVEVGTLSAVKECMVFMEALKYRKSIRP